MKRDILTLIKRDHDKVDTLFKRLKRAKGAETGTRIYTELKNELINHAQAEEVVLYPRLVERKALAEFGREGAVEHSMVRYLISEIDTTKPRDPKWEARITVLQEMVEHHVEEEEKELFPKMRKAFSGEEREALGREFLTAKEQPLARIKGAA